MKYNDLSVREIALLNNLMQTVLGFHLPRVRSAYRSFAATHSGKRSDTFEQEIKSAFCALEYLRGVLVGFRLFKSTQSELVTKLGETLADLHTMREDYERRVNNAEDILNSGN